ncbi:MAG: S8 family serine peptidase [Saprospiraceae bacterium]|nr:S8 family serine peptidase [Saprospiraceae bacterium]
MKKANWPIWALLTILSFQSILLQAQRSDHVPGQYIVWLTGANSIDEVIEDYASISGNQTALGLKKQLVPGYPIYLLQNDPAQFDETLLLNYLRQDVRVAEIQQNHWLSSRSLPDDPMFGNQWNFLNTNGGADIDIDLAWEVTTGGHTASGHPIVIALIDDGIDPDHPDLVSNLWTNSAEISGNGIDDDGNGYVDDFAGWNVQADLDLVQYGIHGVQVAGMLGAKGNNGTGISGTNWDVRIMPIVGISGLESEIVEAYGYALNQRILWQQSGGTAGAFVTCTNTSWGADLASPSDYPLWCAMFDLLGENGILSVAATTNSNVNVDIEGDMPTACSSPYLITVTATDEADQRNFSGFGIQSIDLAAPGEEILTTDINGQYHYQSGTSYACPQVAGIIALLYSVPCVELEILALSDPMAAAITARDAILNGVDPVANLGNEVNSGGRLNAYNSVVEVLNLCDACLAPVGIEATPISDSTVSLDWVSFPGTVETYLKWRELGTLEWNQITNPTAPYILGDLEGCTAYEFRLKVFCSGTQSESPNSITFETLGCCEAPANIQASNITDSSAHLEWEEVYGAETYILRYKTALANTWSSPISTEEPQLDLDSLEACQTYDIKLMVGCLDGAASTFSYSQFEVTGCEFCEEQSYCNPEFYAWFEWIESFTLDGQEIQTGNNDGYFQIFGEDIVLVAGESYPFIIEPGFNNWSYMESYLIWIDFDQNGAFDYPEELVFESPTSTEQNQEGIITIPDSAPEGTSRLRVMQIYTGFGSLGFPFSCTNFIEYGEVEDYCISISETDPNLPPCQTLMDFEIGPITVDTAFISWTSDTTANSYEIRYRLLEETDWIYIQVAEPVLLLDNLEACSTYEIQGQIHCSGDVGGFSESSLFETACIQSELVFQEETSLVSIFPNPFDQQVLFAGIPEKVYQLQLYAIDGRLIQEITLELDSGATTLELPLNPEIAAGMYLLHWKDDRNSGTIRLVKY